MCAHPVHSPCRPGTKIKSWQWPNLLGIDAAIIAVSWMAVFANQRPADSGIAADCVLAFSVWLTYQADRLFDVANRSSALLLSARHRFAKKHQGLLWKIWFGILLINLSTALIGLSREQLINGLYLLIFCLVYTGFNQKLSSHFFPKEVFVAIIFTGGTQVFLLEPTPLLSLSVFGALCLINCLMIANKERAIDARLRIRSLSSFVNNKILSAMLCLAMLGSISSEHTSALLPSLFALTGLHLLREHFETELFRVLCDTSLLFGPTFFFILKTA